MDTEERDRRRREIQNAAVEMLIERGYKSTSLLAVARRAKASNETMYRWYGDKPGLFRAVIKDNASEVSAFLRDAMEGDREPLAALHLVGPMLLALVTSDRAIALNRAAAVDAVETGTLGEALATAGRESVLPLVAGLIRKAVEAGALGWASEADMVESYVGLLIGDLQIRRAIGVIDPPSAEEMEARASRAVAALRVLFPVRAVFDVSEVGGGD